MNKSIELKKVIQLLSTISILYSLYESGIIYITVINGFLLLHYLRDSFWYTLNIAIEAWDYNEPFYSCLKRNINIKLICLSDDHRFLLKEEFSNNLCLNHKFNEFFFIFDNSVFYSIQLMIILIENKIFLLPILLIYFEYKYKFTQSISISFDFKRKTAIKKPQYVKKVQFKSPTRPPVIRAVPSKLSFKPVDTVELTENDDILSSCDEAFSTESKKLTYPTKTNVKDLEKYAPSLEKDFKKGIFFDMTSKEGLTLWGKYLNKLSNNTEANKTDISPMAENYKMIDTKIDIDVELRKMKDKGLLLKYLDVQYRRVFIPELKVWVTKNRLAKINQL